MLDPLADLRARFAARTIERVGALRTAIERVAVDHDALARIVELAHQLAGSAGTFGHTDLSRAAATLEAIARQRCSSSALTDRDTLERALSEIESCAARLASPSRF
jgi:HPt (histidine-containing phosphotransfer) domain-containing protein